ncbi:hypothetical protein GUITHDRAFT_166737 [Guillardia theta CCMP2712]|uniref:CCDC81 HU domain-containing protein n=2 Tax=Guillardia theta TaxID=55529 RepID=L1I7X2_GUITC|nr:hypothetical protein GUITHDRAFT_166737 [Guillardia theta CCMP2712]EKX32308.1 hypothetical protein GUITHDRAFT_166737 [Guillardia theta CCMP2712]|eukprot:XP_005819288.1 hypothetical protein GUITHDRAFT_166737 [Guillardia theta CCMP2712]
MEKIFAEVQKRPFSMKKLPKESIKNVWNSLSQVLCNTLRSGKGLALANFGVWSFHVDPLDLGTQKKTLRTPVFTLSEKFARQYNLRFSRRPSSISGSIPVRDLNLVAIANMAGESRDTVSDVLKDIVMYAGEAAMSGGSIRLEFYGVGSWTCQGGSSRFVFSPQFDGIFESHDRPRTTHGVLPPSPSVFARSRPRSSRWIPPTPPRSRPHSSGALQEQQAILSPSSDRRKATPSREELQEQANFPSRPFSNQSARSARSVERDLVATPSSGKRLRISQRGEEGEGVRVVRVEEQGLKAEELEIVIRNGELLVLQESIGLHRNFPLSSRADVEKIEAAIRQRTLEVRIPDKTQGLRSFYDSQIRERDGIKKLEEEVDTLLLEQTKKRNEAALESEKEMQDARRRARKEIEDFNRKLITQKQQRRNVFEPESCGFLLYNRTEAKSKSLPPQVLRSLLDAQVRDKKQLVEQTKEAEREQVMRETEELRISLEEEERKAREEKRNAQLARREELRQQVETLQPRLPGAFSALCNFPRRDEEAQLRELKKKEVKKVYDEVLEMVNTREMQSMQLKKTQNLQEMEEMEEIKQSIEEEQEEKRKFDITQKLTNRETWRKQINDKREKVRSQLVQGQYATSLPVGEAELGLTRSIRPEVVAA